MASKAIPNTILVLRIFTLLSLVASVVLFFLDNFTLDGEKQRFQDVITYRFVVSTATIGAAYTIFQLPLNIYYAFTEKRLIRSKCMPDFDFYADKVISLLLAAGVGAGFGVGFEFKRFLEVVFPVLAALGGLEDLDEAQTKNDDFFDQANIATGVLLVGATCMAVVSLLTAITRTSNRGFFG